MNTQQLENLTGRIDGLAQALLRLTAQLEMQGYVDGPQLSQAWQAARPEHLAVGPVLQASRCTLVQLAQELDSARAHREHHQ
ncbi:hypothetical protein ACLS0R_07760 [Comamonas jiangduensis]|uniref:hypothetical protein n=1 Tax=Comamonas jiangduensis TaxID=1194168 RepID=UPI003BF77383